MSLAKMSCIVASVLSLSACATLGDATVTMNHSVSSLAEVSAVLTVNQFDRTLPDGVEANQFETTGYTFGKQILLTENLQDHFRLAFVQEARRAGASLRGEASCSIDATVDKMALNYEGSRKLTFDGTVTYHVNGPDGSKGLSKTVSALETTPTSNVEGVFAKFNTKLIDGLLMDEGFDKFVRTSCPST